VIFLTLALAAPAAAAATITVTLKDATGAALENAVVWAIPKTGPVPRPRPGAVEQKNKTFIPLVSVVQTGALVSFPNRDEIRHHVYSFSPAKRFEIKLYAGTPVDPIAFDKPGEVVLGCNIHDHMIGYVYVVDTPWFAKSDREGRARIEGLPAGEYEVHARHFAQAAPQGPAALRLAAEDNATAAFVIVLRQMPPRPAPQ